MKIKKTGWLKLGAALAVSGIVLAGCAATPEPAPETPAPAPETPAETAGGYDPQPLAERTTITVNTAARVEPFTALFLAEAMGEFEKENLEIEFTSIATQDGLAALGQDQIHVLGGPPSASVFNAIDAGVNVKPAIACYTDNADSWWISADLADQGAAALEGAVVGTATGPSGTSILGLDNYLAGSGVSISDLTIERFPAADVPTALIQDAIVAAYIPEPGARAVDNPDIAVATDSMPRDAGSSQCTYLFGPDLLETRPEVGHAFVRAIARTMRDYLQGDYKADEDLVADIAAALETTPEQILGTPSAKFDPTVGFDGELYTRVQELWIEIGDIVNYDEPMDPADVIAFEFTDALNQ